MLQDISFLLHCVTPSAMGYVNASTVCWNRCWRKCATNDPKIGIGIYRLPIVKSHRPVLAFHRLSYSTVVKYGARWIYGKICGQALTQIFWKNAPNAIMGASLTASFGVSWKTWSTSMRMKTKFYHTLDSRQHTLLFCVTCLSVYVCLAIVFGIQRFQKYLYGTNFLLQTDLAP